MTTIGRLDIAGVTKRFAGVLAVDDVTATAEAGTILGLIGPNGAGKTTLVNLITGYFEPDHGEIRLDGTSLTGRRPHQLAAAGLARTYQNLRLFDGATALENVLVGRHLMFRGNAASSVFGRAVDRRQRAVAGELLDRVGLAALGDTDVAELPYGLRRRVEIARALAAEPTVLLLDEPTAGMTRAEKDDIVELVRQVNRSGTTIVLVEHDVRLVTELCDQLLVLNWGAVVTQGTADEVWADERVRSAYLGELA